MSLSPLIGVVPHPLVGVDAGATAIWSCPTFGLRVVRAWWDKAEETAHGLKPPFEEDGRGRGSLRSNDRRGAAGGSGDREAMRDQR